MRKKVSTLDLIEKDTLQKELDEAGDLTPISIREARRAMGDEAKYLSDDDIQIMVFDLTAIARAYVNKFPKY